MRLVIVPDDGTVGCNDAFYTGLDLSACDIPVDVHALHWHDDRGWIEYKSDPFDGKPHNLPISELPQWARACAMVNPPDEEGASDATGEPTPLDTTKLTLSTALDRLHKTAYLMDPDIQAELDDCSKSCLVDYRKALISIAAEAQYVLATTPDIAYAPDLPELIAAEACCCGESAIRFKRQA